MILLETKFPDLLILEPRIYTDVRGFFYESYNQESLNELGIKYNFIQDNHSSSSYGVLRGLHYQNGSFAQTKLVRVVRGAVIDVVVDLRIGSPTYLQNFTIELNEENKRQLLIPKGFAHGFVVISEVADFLYKCDKYYNKASEGGLIFNDPTLAIEWGIPTQDIIVSEKDGQNSFLQDAVFDFPFEEYTGQNLYDQ